MVSQCINGESNACPHVPKQNAANTVFTGGYNLFRRRRRGTSNDPKPTELFKLRFNRWDGVTCLCCTLLRATFFLMRSINYHEIFELILHYLSVYVVENFHFVFNKSKVNTIFFYINCKFDLQYMIKVAIRRVLSCCSLIEIS